jgi:hypothetical protein
MGAAFQTRRFCDRTADSGRPHHGLAAAIEYRERSRGAEGHWCWSAAILVTRHGSCVAVGNGGQCGTGIVANMAMAAMKNLQLADSIEASRVRIPLSPPV